MSEHVWYNAEKDSLHIASFCEYDVLAWSVFDPQALERCIDLFLPKLEQPFELQYIGEL